MVPNNAALPEVPAGPPSHPEMELVSQAQVQTGPLPALANRMMAGTPDPGVKKAGALAGVAQWIEHWTVKQKFPCSIPGWGTCLG